MAKSLALGARHHGGSSPLYPTKLEYSSIGLEHCPDTTKVESSSLSIPTIRINPVPDEKTMWFESTTGSMFVLNACVVQLVECRSPKPKIKVRVLACVQNIKK